MPKKNFVWLIAVFCMLLPLVAACGSSTNTSPGTSTGPAAKATLPVGENIYVLDGYTPQGVANMGQSIVAFHPGNANPVYRLPAGLTSMDHRLLIVAQAQSNLTTISVINTQSSATLRTLTLAGNYSTAGQDFNNAVLSFDGHWLALRQLDQSISQTTIALIDTQAGKLSQTIHLSGEFDLDAINATGSAIYLLERWNNGSGQYGVRRYDVPQHKLYEAQIIDKTELNDPNMTGRAVARQMASNGTTAYTLYIDTYHNIAFVHILPLDPGFPFARCVELPVGKSAALLDYYTLTLSADGGTLYAANGALGIASAITLNTASVTDVFNDKIAATQHFNAGASTVTNADKSRMLRNGAALSSDQSTLYFAGLNGIWSVNTSDLEAGRGAFKHALGQQSFTGIALSADSKTLYAVDPTSGITLLDVISGQTQQVLQGPAHTPWDIEWIVN
jgi:DNA-binding beta-propeller fold protein YncE